MSATCFEPEGFIFRKAVVYTVMVWRVVFFLLGNSPASEFYMPTFRNYLFQLQGDVSRKNSSRDSPASEFCVLPTPPMKMEQTECFETSAHKIQAPVDHPKERIQSAANFEIKYGVTCLHSNGTYCLYCI
jgi:hypothetical protein